MGPAQFCFKYSAPFELTASIRMTKLAITISIVVSFLFLLSPCGAQFDSRTPIRILTLVPWPNNRVHAGWDDGLSLLTAGRLAMNEINNNTNLLTDYRIELIARGHEACGLQETDNSTSNFIENAVYPKTLGNVSAVAGLFCSTSTEPVALTAGHSEFDLLQLSASNSPVFRSRLKDFPHLWRFIISAEVYGQMMLKLMEHFQWKSVAIVQDLETIFHSEIGESFEQLVTSHPDYTLVYHYGLIKTIDSFYMQALESIQESGARVIFVAANSPQVAKLLCYASQYNMIYPDYQWIIADYLADFIVGEDMCDKATLQKALNGSITSYFKIGIDDPETVIVSNKTYAEYSQSYKEELGRVQSEYSQYAPINGDQQYGGLLYDQIWAFALALEAALPELERQNYSIADYGYGQPNITKLLEAELAKVNFLGSTGKIQFGNYREVSTTINIYQVIDDGTDKFVGVCTFSGEDLNITNLTLERDIFVPSDEIPKVLTLLPDYASFTVGMVIALVTFLVIATHVGMIYYRNTPLIKASSPAISSLMLMGCYLLCLAAVLNLITASAMFVPVVFGLLCNGDVLMAFNGINLILVTLFFKILRIYRIFHNKKLVHLSCIWKNWLLSLIIIAICTCPNLLFVVWFSVDPLVQTSSQLFMFTNGSGLPHNRVITLCRSNYETVFYLLIIAYLVVFMICVVYVAARTSRIQQKNFKDTKKVNFFVFLIFLSSFTSAVVTVLLHSDSNSGNSTLGAHLSQILGYLTLPFLCVMLLFAPKLIPLIFPSTSEAMQQQMTSMSNRRRTLSRTITKFLPAII